jgi:hypothetical protein
MKHSIEVPPEPLITPIESDGLSNCWYGLERYPGNSHPRFTTAPAAIVQAIPTKAEAARASDILTEFAAMLAQYDEQVPYRKVVISKASIIS